MFLNPDDTDVCEPMVRCGKCRISFPVSALPRVDIEHLNGQFQLASHQAELADYQAFAVLAKRYPLLSRLIRPIYSRPIPIPPKLSVALAGRLDHELSMEECEVLDRRNDRYYDFPFRIHTLIREIESLTEQLAEKSVICPSCGSAALTVDRHVYYDGGS